MLGDHLEELPLAVPQELLSHEDIDFLRVQLPLAAKLARLSKPAPLPHVAPHHNAPH